VGGEITRCDLRGDAGAEGRWVRIMTDDDGRINKTIMTDDEPNADALIWHPEIILKVAAAITEILFDEELKNLCVR
jgi:hypothetical protein